MADIAVAFLHLSTSEQQRSVPVVFGNCMNTNVYDHMNNKKKYENSVELIL